jgi:phosphohistidine phosphatase
MKLWVIRHAKSSWDDPKIPDFGRPLNRRGKHDGPRVAKWLGKQDDLPEWIVSSDAVRAKATTEFVAHGANVPDTRVVYDHRMYLAEVETILEVIRSMPVDVRSCAVVGHNPGLSRFVNEMLGQPVIDELPTFGIAKLDVAEPWSTLALGSARLDTLFRPKDL